MSKIYGIIAAAGRGLRFGGLVPKHQLILSGQTLLDRVLAVFSAERSFESVVLCLSEDNLAIPVSAKDLTLHRVVGGASRAESVQKGFLHLGADDDDIILIHDAARPLVIKNLLTRLITAAKKLGAVIPILPVTDTIKVIAGDNVTSSLNRADLAAVQTPQAFRAGILRRAYETVPTNSKWTDEAMLVEASGQPVYVIAGEENNIKITTPRDLVIAEVLLREG